MTRLAWKTRLLTAGAMALALAACKDDDARNAAPPAATLAVLDPTASLLPPAPPAPVARAEPAQGYRWAERAYGVQRAVYDSPPDYGFAYGDEEPLAWETADDWSMYAEPRDDGYRYYYYQPGAAYPYFVRDDDYGYGYDRGGTLIVVVDAAGRYLPAQEFRRVAPIAGRYYAHGRDLRHAGLHAQRIRVDERAWAVRAPRVSEGADRWLAAGRDDRAWRQWREADRNRELDRFTAEQLRRAEVQRTRVAERNRRDDFRRGDVRPDEAFGRDQNRRQDEQRRLAELRPRQDQARAAEQNGRDGAARAQAERQAQQAAQQRQRADADRQQRAQHDARARQLEADVRQRQQHQAQEAQTHAAHERQMQADASLRDQHQAQQAQAREAHDRQMQAQNQQRDAQQAQQARQRAGQAPARAADQQARQAAAHERASPPPRPHDQSHPNGKPDGQGKDKERKD